MYRSHRYCRLRFVHFPCFVILVRNYGGELIRLSSRPQDGLLRKRGTGMPGRCRLWGYTPSGNGDNAPFHSVVRNFWSQLSSCMMITKFHRSLNSGSGFRFKLPVVAHAERFWYLSMPDESCTTEENFLILLQKWPLWFGGHFKGALFAISQSPHGADTSIEEIRVADHSPERFQNVGNTTKLDITAGALNNR